MDLPAEIDKAVQVFVTRVIALTHGAATGAQTGAFRRARRSLEDYRSLTMRVHAFVHANSGATIDALVRRLGLPASELELSLWELRLRGEVRIRCRGGVVTYFARLAPDLVRLRLVVQESRHGE